MMMVSYLEFISSWLKLELQVSSIQGHNEPIEDIATNKYLAAIGCNASHSSKRMTLNIQADIIDGTLRKSAIIPARPKIGSGAESQLKHKDFRDDRQIGAGV